MQRYVVQETIEKYGAICYRSNGHALYILHCALVLQQISKTLRKSCIQLFLSLLPLLTSFRMIHGEGTSQIRVRSRSILGPVPLVKLLSGDRGSEAQEESAGALWALAVDPYMSPADEEPLPSCDRGAA